MALPRFGQRVYKRSQETKSEALPKNLQKWLKNRL